MARCCCRNRRCVGRFGVIEWKPPRVPGSHAWDGEGAEMAMGMGVQASTRLPIPVGDSPYSKVFAQNFVSASLSEVTVQRQHGRPVYVANGISLKP